MTSRLQRKIALSQQPHHHSNNSSSNSQPYGNLDESFVSVGTALPSLLDSKKDANEFKPAWEQEVLDEQGRRRFHGAFTGGFSAGYFNSVGSKEGWTPSTFKSSRANRGNQAGGAGGSVVDAARQFMDDEDLAELASSRTLETSSAYASRSAAPPPSATSAKADYDPLLGLFGPLPSSSRPSASTSTEAPSSAAGVFDSTLASLIAPSESRIGLKLMRKMGWREGQGVGPRIALSERKKQAKELGIVLPSSEEGEEAEGGEAEKHLYPPLDRPLTLVKGTSASGDRGWGLGYQPGMTLDARLRNEGSVGGGGGARQTFYEEDEEDAYGAAAGGPGRLGERERRALGAYEDEEMDEDFDRIKRTGSGRNAKSTPKRFTRQQEFVDGSQVLPGFTLEVNAIAGPSTSRLPPPPPPGWQPDPTRLWKENAPPSSANANGKGKGRQLDAEERGSLLGEKLPPPPSPMPKSVFDYLSAKSRERLATVTSGGSAPPPSAVPNSSRPPPSGLTGANNAPLGASSRFGNASSTSAPPQPPPVHIAEPDAQLFVPPLDRPTALSALRGFQPYSAASTSPDPIKQARYTLYLQYQSSDSASTTSSPFGPRTLPNGKQQTVEELNRELNEYAQAARVFKPVSGMLGNRFQTSQTGAFDAPKIEPGLWQPPPKASKPAGTDSLTAAYGDASSASSAPQKPPEPALTPAQQAARAGNFGVGTTRTVSAFRPSKLLCKRFGVRDPFESSDGSGDAGGEDAGGKFGEATATGWGTGNAAPGAGAGGAKEAVSKEAMEEMMNSVGFKRFQAAAEAEDSVTDGEVAKGVFETPELFAGGSGGVGGGARKGQPRVKPTLETVGLGDDEEQGQEIVEEMRAPVDIFKAIFADSDDDSSDDEVEEENQPVVAVVPAAATASTDPFPPPPPPPPAAILVTEEPAISLSLSDLASLKPSFVSRDASTSTSTSKKEKKSSSSGKSKSKRKAATLSFDVDDGGEGEEGGREEERARERKRVRKEKEKKEKAREEEKREVKPAAGQAATALEAVLVVEEEDEWAEAAPQVHPSILAREKSEGGGGEKKGRVRAADLY